MAWQCPQCKRSFKNRNQQHSCVRVKINDLFINKSPVVQSLYEKLRDTIKKFGEVKIHASREAINFSVENTFFLIKPNRERLEIEFLLDEEITEEPVYKSFRLSKTKWALYATIESKTDITKKLVNLLKRSYKLSVK